MRMCARVRTCEPGEFAREPICERSALISFGPVRILIAVRSWDQGVHGWMWAVRRWFAPAYKTLPVTWTLSRVSGGVYPA